MDYGTGSGVLACAACVLGAKESIGVDIEKQSIIAAQQNAALNGISDTTLFLECLPDTDPSMEPLLCAGVPEEQRRFDMSVRQQPSSLSLIIGLEKRMVRVCIGCDVHGRRRVNLWSICFFLSLSNAE